MGMDSVDVVMCWEEAFGIEISDETVSVIKTPKESIELLVTLLNADRNDIGASLNFRAFNLIRNILINEFKIHRKLIKPNTMLSKLFFARTRRKNWARLQELLRNYFGTSVYIGGPLYGYGGPSIETLVMDIVARRAFVLKKKNETWTYNQIREVVRNSVTYVNGATDFLDTDEYFGKIGFG